MGVADTSAQSAAPGPSLLFRLPRPTYLILIFLVFGITPVALYGGPGEGAPAKISLLTLFYLVPVLAALYIARTSTKIDQDAIRVSAIFGSRTLDWADIRGLSVDGRNVYAVIGNGSVRLPCVRQRDLTIIAAASGGRLPELPLPRIKSAPSRHR